MNGERITPTGFRNFYNPPPTTATPEELAPRSAWSVPLSAKDRRRIEFELRALALDSATLAAEVVEFVRRKYSAKLAA